MILDLENYLLVCFFLKSGIFWLFDTGTKIETVERLESAPKRTRKNTRRPIGDVAMHPLPKNADGIELKATAVTVVEIGWTRSVVEEENRRPRRRGFDPTFACAWFINHTPVGERTLARAEWWMCLVWEKLLFGWTWEISS